jgi:hypothetical protein
MLQVEDSAMSRRHTTASWPLRTGVLLLMLGMVGLFSLAKIGQYAPRASRTHLISQTTKMGEGRQFASIPNQDSSSARLLIQCFWDCMPLSMFPRIQIGILPVSSVELSTVDIHRAPRVLLI